MCELISAVAGEAGWKRVRVSASVGGARMPLTASAAGAADMIRPAVKERTMRVVVMKESAALARGERGGGGVVVAVGRGRGTVLVGVTRTGCWSIGGAVLVVVL
jgi:hypothetical protein